MVDLAEGVPRQRDSGSLGAAGARLRVPAGVAEVAAQLGDVPLELAEALDLSDAQGDAGVTRLVHTPNKDFTTYEQAERVAQTGSIVAGMIAFGAPNIDTLSGPPAAVQWPKDNTTRFRDGKPWRWYSGGAP